jgi:hypothetical protein
MPRFIATATDARNQLSKIRQLTADNVLQNSFRKLAQRSEERFSSRKPLPPGPFAGRRHPVPNVRDCLRKGFVYSLMYD